MIAVTGTGCNLTTNIKDTAVITIPTPCIIIPNCFVVISSSFLNKFSDRYYNTIALYQILFPIIPIKISYENNDK
jgi:hypothetical protein